MRLNHTGALVALFAFLLCSGPVKAETGIASTGLNVRAGPGPGYPVVGYIPHGTQVDIIGCVSGWKWCDVQTGGGGLLGLFGGGGRGWVAGNYLNGYYNNSYAPVSGIGSLLGLSTLVFDEPDYWGRYYYDRPFYRQRYYNTRYWNQNARLRSQLQAERDRNRYLREQRVRSNAWERERARQRNIDRRDDRREAQQQRVQQQRAAQQQHHAAQQQKKAAQKANRAERKADRAERRENRNK